MATVLERPLTQLEDAPLFEVVEELATGPGRHGETTLVTSRHCSPGGPRDRPGEVERETASWVHWYNTTCIHHSIGKMSPIEFEDHHRHTNPARTDEVAKTEWAAGGSVEACFWTVMLLS